MRFCTNCGNKLPDGVKYCSRCGVLQTSVRKPKKSKAPVVAVGLILLILSVVICLFQLRGGIELKGSEEAAVSEKNRPQGLNLEEEFYPFYAEMDEVEKTTYEDILAGIETGSDQIYLSRSDELYTSNEVGDIAIKIAYEHPELFWFEGSITCYSDEKNHIVYVTPTYNDLYDDLEKNKSEINLVVDQLLKETESMSDVEAEKYFVDYLCNNVTYVEGEYDQNIYSAFVQKETVCSGYAHALQYLMVKRGVPCYFATGWAYNYHTKESGRHAWNIIKLDGGFYNCDVTFSDRALEKDQLPSYISYEFFNITDSEMDDGMHSRDTYGQLLPECTATALSYNAIYGDDWEYSIVSDYPGKVVTTLDEFYNLLYEKLVTEGSGAHDFTFVITADAYCQVDTTGSDEQFSEKVVYPAARALGFGNWSNSYWSATYYWLDGEQYLFVDMHLELT